MSTFATKQKTQSHAAKSVFKPHKYQKASVKFMVSRPAAGLFLDPGLGKTIITYTTYEVLRELKYVGPLVVVTLLRPMYKVWPSEIKKWGLKLKHVVLHGGKKSKLLREDADVYIVNYDGLPWLLRELTMNPPSWLKRKPMLVFDESSKLRNTNTKRFKTVRKLIKWFARRYILTGSPTPKGLMNLFGQIFVLDGGVALGQYITHFRNKYFDATPIGAYGPVIYDIKPGASEQIYDAVKDLVIRFDDSEIDMPKLISQTIEVELPQKVRMIYDDIERDLITAIGKNVVIAKNAGVATQKLRQIANGGLYIDNDNVRVSKKLHDEKTEAVLELLDELEGQPALIGYEFHHDLERLRAALPDAPCLTDAPMKKYHELEEAWNKGEIPVALAQISALSHGNNLQGGRAVILHSHVWDYEAYDQFIRRIYRQGQKAKRVFVYHIVAKNTVDEAVLASMSIKGATQKDLFNALKAHMRRRAR